MKNTFKINLRKALLLILLVLSLNSIANFPKKFNADYGLTFASRQYWRGVVYSTSPCLQPEITFVKNNFSLNLWVSESLDGKSSEIDFIPSYTLANFTFSIYDYYNPVYGESNHYFNYKKGQNRHSTELNILYHPNKYPFQIMVASFFFGDINSISGLPYYSTYAELAYKIPYKKFTGELVVGATPFGGYYAAKMAIIQSSISIKRDFMLSENLSLPIQLAFNYNPYLNQSTFIFKVIFESSF